MAVHSSSRTSKSGKRTQNLSLTVEFAGLRDALKDMRVLPKEYQDAIRDASSEIAGELSSSVQSAARSDRSPQGRLLAGTVKVKRDRVPVIQAGGATRVGRNRAKAGALIYGSEFGSDHLPQFHKKHNGTEGSWFYPTVNDQADDAMTKWGDAVAGVFEKWARDRG